MKKLLTLVLIVLTSAGIASAQGSTSAFLDMTPGFSRYAKGYVEKLINIWQQKGEYEKTADYKHRIETQRDAKIRELTQEARSNYIAEQMPADLKGELHLGAYNADAEVFMVSHPKYGEMALPVPLDDAPKFRQTWTTTQAHPRFVIENDHLALAELVFKPAKGKKTYRCQRADMADFAEAEVSFDFDPIEIEIENPVAELPAKRQSRPGVSDIDTDIPVGGKTANGNTFAVVISNEKYRRVSSVDYAHNDGKAMHGYLTSTLGIPESQIHFVRDATLNDIRAELDWMQEVSKAYRGDASFVFYYAGHGIPDEATRSGYLLPVDGYGSNAASGLAMSELNDRLATMPSRLTLVMLDACFSGAVRNGDMLAAARGVALKVRPDKVKGGNVVVLSASQDDETAAKYDDQRHGLFTYFLLKGIREAKGDLSLGQLADYVREQVGRRSVVDNRKPQTPAVHTSPAISDSWTRLNLSRLSK